MTAEHPPSGEPTRTPEAPASAAPPPEPGALGRLRSLVPPPARPVETGNPDAWAEVEAELGTALPADYRAFTNAYGSGRFDDFLWLFNPFAPVGPGNLVDEKTTTLDAYARTRSRFPDRLPLPPFPEPGGVLPLGRTDNGDELYWITEGQADQWHVLVLASRATRQERHRMSVTAFLAALLAGHLETRLFPDDLISRREHVFSPFA
jgi:hypothetical protein